MEPTTEAVQGLKVREVMQAVYQELGKRFNVELLAFSEPAYTIIAGDNDHHRGKRGNMRYENALLLPINGTTWAIALGVKSGSYPGDEYDSDLVAFEILEEQKGVSQVRQVMMFIHQSCDWFRYSILVCFKDGNFDLMKRSKYGRQMIGLLADKDKEFLVCEAERDETKIMASTLQPRVSQAARYKPEVVPFLADCIVRVLESQ